MLLHGYGETGDMWAPLAAELARDHTVDRARSARHGPVVESPRAATTRRRKAGDVAGVLDALKIDSADLVAHDIGNMVGFAFAAQHPRARDAASS